MSGDTRPPRPAPGTLPVVGEDFEPRLKRHYPEPAIDAHDRASGKVTLTEQLLVARAEVEARNLAAAGQPELEARVPSIGWELDSSMRVKVFRRGGEVATERAEAAAVLDAAERAVEEGETMVAGARSRVEQVRAAIPFEPWSGLVLTDWWTLLLGLPVPAALEIAFSKESLLTALPTVGGSQAVVVAGGIAVILTLGAELAALVLGRQMASLRRGGAVLAALAITLGLAGLVTWSVKSMADSRAPNLAYQQSLAPPVSAANGSFGLGTGTLGDHVPQLGTAAPPRAASAPSEPRLDFVVPVTLLALAVGMVLSLRVGIARPWRAARAELDTAEAGERDAQVPLVAAHAEREAAIREIDRLDVAFAAFVNEELATTNRLLDHLQGQYENACARRGRTGGLLPRPATTPAEHLISAVLDPYRAPLRRAAGDPVSHGEAAPMPQPMDDPQPPVVDSPPRVDEPPVVDLWAADEPPAAAASDPALGEDRPIGWTWDGPGLDPHHFDEGHIPDRPGGP